MYGLIHFDVAKKDFYIPDNIKKISISNPDVEHHNAYATFSINDINKKCYILNISTKPFEKEGDSFVNYYRTIIAPIDKEVNDIVQIVFMQKLSNRTIILLCNRLS